MHLALDMPKSCTTDGSDCEQRFEASGAVVDAHRASMPMASNANLLEALAYEATCRPCVSMDLDLASTIYLISMSQNGHIPCVRQTIKARRRGMLVASSSSHALPSRRTAGHTCGNDTSAVNGGHTCGNDMSAVLPSCNSLESKSLHNVIACCMRPRFNTMRKSSRCIMCQAVGAKQVVLLGLRLLMLHLCPAEAG